MASAMHTDHAERNPDRRRDRFEAAGHEQRVLDFYRSQSSTFFGAVVSTCAHASTSGSRSGREPCPTLVTLLGQLDLETAPVLGECFASLSGSVEVDCSGLDIVDAEGPGIFATALARTDANVVFVDPTGSR